MKTYLFLDDWMLDSYSDIVRRFGCPKPVSVDPVLGINYSSVIRDPEQGYRLWANKPTKLPGYERPIQSLHLYESSDGYHWTPKEPKDTDPPILPSGDGAKVYYDSYDSDPRRRYKAAFVKASKGHSKNGQWIGSIDGFTACSRDGIKWKVDDKHPFFTRRGGVDTYLAPLFNPITGRYQIVVRPSVLDRRIAMVESTDFIHWTDTKNPRVILYPDPLDEPCLQFYGMPWFFYEDLFIGLLWSHHISQEEKGCCKMSGIIDCELAYSYNGVHWNRTNRQPFIGRTEPGHYGCGSIYPHSLLIDENEQIRIYSSGYLCDHGIESVPQGYKSISALIVHTLRKDGFAYLEPRAGWGMIRMRCLRPECGEITINFRAPLGKVLVQISDPYCKPIPGYSFADCIPLTGDELAAHPRWKKHADVSELIGKQVRLEFRLFQAELYAVRWDSKPYYGDFPIERI